VANIGPISVGINVMQGEFDTYKTGVYMQSDCPPQPNHAVLVVGYGTDEQGMSSAQSTDKNSSRWRLLASEELVGYKLGRKRVYSHGTKSGQFVRHCHDSQLPSRRRRGSAAGHACGAGTQTGLR
jgi:hypothetical protein